MTDQTQEASSPSESPWIQWDQVGDAIYGGFVICRGCGAAVPLTLQPALKAHSATCEPLRRTR